MSDLPQFKAGGTIRPARFVQLMATENATVEEADAGDIAVIGVAHESTKNAPQTGGSSNAAEDEDPIRVYSYGREAMLEIGAGGITCGVELKPDADGKGVAATTTNDVAFAIALETAAASELCRVMVHSAHYVQ